MALGVAAAATTTMGAVGIPGQASFVTSIAPICIAMGVPIEPLALLIAVEVAARSDAHDGQCQHGRRRHRRRRQRSGFEAEEAESREDKLLKEGA